MAAANKERSSHLLALLSGATLRLVISIVVFSWLSSTAAAATIVGRVVNLSRNRPSTGDDVILYKVDQTMHELDRTKSDIHGNFQFAGRVAFRFLVAVRHQNVSYHTGQLNGKYPIEISVFDATPRLRGLDEASVTLFPRLAGDVLQITEFLSVVNSSNPPCTLLAGQTFSFRLPRGATLDSTAVQPPETLPLLVKASTCGGREQYCIAYPIRPGTTRVRAIYHLPYAASTLITLPMQRPANEVAVMIPASLHFEARTPGIFRDRGKQNGLSVYLASRTPPIESLGFTLSGTEHGARIEAAIPAPNPAGHHSPTTECSAASLRTAGLAHPPQQLNLMSPGKRTTPWRIMIGALICTIFLAVLSLSAVLRFSI